MPRHFVRKFTALSFAALFAAVTLLATHVSLVEARAESSQNTALAQSPHRTAGSPGAGLPPVGRSERKVTARGAVDFTTISFLPAVLYDSGAANPNVVAVADVNGDGKLDLIVADCDPSGSGGCGFVRNGVVGVLLGNGDGTFQPAVIYDSGGNLASGLAVADVNGDGKLDVIVTHECTDKGCEKKAGVSVLLGNGDGTFKPAVTYNSGSLQSSSVAVADVNGDGKPDLLVTNICTSGIACGNSNGIVSVLLGNGDGTFQAPVSYDSGGIGPMSIAAAAVNGDGKIDLLVANCGCADGDFYSPGTVSVLLGNGDGTFRPAESYSAGQVPWSIAVADVNGDGHPDLLVADACWCGHDGTAAVLLGNGDGTFQPAVTYDAGAGLTFSIAVADVDGDGKPDLVVEDSEGSDSNRDSTTGVLLGNGDGTFQPVVTFDSGVSEANSLVPVDVNGDGKPDLVIPASNGTNYDGTVAVFLNNTGESESPTTTALASSLNPSTYGQTVTFTATLNSSSGTPTGTVIFYDSSTSIGSVTLTSGTAMLATSSLAVGSHSITAAFQGSSSFSPSTSPVLTQVLNGTTVATTTAIATSKNPGIYQQPVTFTATVTSASGTPTGTVVFIEDGKFALASATLVNGSASFTTSGLKRGKYAMTAAYLGSGNFAPSTSPALEEWINRSGLFQTHIVLRGSGSPSLVGQPVTFTATVTSKYGEIPDGDVVDFFTGDDGGLGSATTENGQASITTSSLRAGVLTIFAYYEGDDDFNTSLTSQKQTVDKDPTTTTVTASPNPAVYGQAITYTATVTSRYGTPTGNVRISDLGLVPLVNGVATITKNLVRAGTHDIIASYQSDSDFARSTSPVYKEVVTSASTTTVLVSSSNPSSPGQTVTFTATVRSSAGVNPFGTVTFTAGSTTLGTVALKDGVASVSTASLAAGSTLITATYNGADSFTGSSASLTQVVQ